MTIHVGAYQSRLPELLTAVCKLKVRHAENSESFVPGTVLVAPPDKHMLVDGKKIRLMLQKATLAFKDVLPVWAFDSAMPCHIGNAIPIGHFKYG